MASVTYDSVTIRYPGADHPSVSDFELEIADGEFLVLVGPSGCGKSTTLRALAGLEPVESGRIFIGDEDVTDADPAARDVAMVFQNYALYPHLSVRKNMSFALDLRKMDKSEVDERVAEAAGILGLGEFLDRKPKDLSGGQRQRVAMGRAIVRNPRVFLMDEPLSNLDAKLRVTTRAEIAALQRRLGTTTVYVTHDQVEAMTMGDRVAVLNQGVLQQVASPRELYRNPVNLFVAGFIGSPSMNLFHDDAPGIAPHGVPSSQLTLGVRPEDMRLLATGTGASGAPVPEGWRELEAAVEIIEELGSESFVYANRGGERLVARIIDAAPPARGDKVRFVYDPARALRFGPDGERVAS
ncbi:sugar ABC transporter ATP-binding protein [Corynebacterium atypicum]|uniref:Sugar ABC transporter ATP-binding protein n=1 Tax=Corynebacterium atypicum TaxID=191610 RepID=A0ABN4DC51_9CORY|nr:ATP-binding cassette domain-containing protein [Corynebacterium atypicum]AIG63767.1 sugar ABC transporter ATP-binding protein [Corynebacterium atypicum]